MPSVVRSAGSLVTAALVAAAVALVTAAVAAAEPLPNPDPVPVPATDYAGMPTPETAIEGTEVQTSTIESGLPVNLVPNINGYPCTGGWESAVCYAMGQDNMPVVQPRSTLSSSP